MRQERAGTYLSKKSVIDLSNSKSLSNVLKLTRNKRNTHTHSLVCAMCLGLGGHPKLLGRAKDVKEFVRFGMRKATIEITLHDDEPNVITRIITRDNKSTFKLNGKNVSKSKILELVASYVEEI